MIFRFLFLGLVFAFAGCTTISTKRVVFDRHPIGVQVINTVVDEEEIVYTVKLRNVGRDIMSFDYTISDEPGIPHVDQFGPNSGLIRNLYPGEEREIENPFNRMAVHVTLGNVTYGKKLDEELEAIYNTDVVVRELRALESSGSTAGSAAGTRAALEAIGNE